VREPQGAGNGKAGQSPIGPQRSGGERSEPERSEGPMGAAPEAGEPGRSAPDPEVSEKPRRRTFTAEYKRRIVREGAQCTRPGQLGELMRREGLYSSHLTEWRRQFERGGADGLAPKKRGRKAKPVNPDDKRVAQLEREKRRLEARLAQAELIIDIQKKVSQMLGIPLKTLDDDGSDS